MNANQTRSETCKSATGNLSNILWVAFFPCKIEALNTAQSDLKVTPEVMNSNEVMPSTTSCMNLESDNLAIKIHVKCPYARPRSQNNPSAIAAPIPTTAKAFAASIFAADPVRPVVAAVADVVTPEVVDEGRIVIWLGTARTLVVAELLPLAKTDPSEVVALEPLAELEPALELVGREVGTVGEARLLDEQAKSYT